MIDRVQEWEAFSEMVKIHIKEYTIPQYGNSTDPEIDQVGAWTARDCLQSIMRYINRYGKNARGDVEQMRDFLKIAHYGALAYFRWKEGKK
jgi:hypothetical protein